LKNFYALRLEKNPREAWWQDSKDMKHDLYFVAWLVNCRELEK